jgi:ribosomal protein L40E
MSPYKAFLNNVRQYFNTSGFFRFLLSGYIFIFAIGGLLYLLSAFIPAISEPFNVISGILMYAGIILTLLREDMMTMVITSGVISLGSLVAWIIGLVGRDYGFGFMGIRTSVFLVTPFLYFLMFGAIAIVVFVKAEKFKQMRAASAAARAQAGIACPRCGAFVPVNAAFCPACGVPNPAMQQYGAVPQAPPQATPQAPPQAPPQYGPVTQAAPAQPEAAPVPKCASCGADVPPGAAFCAKCGAKQ